MIPSTRPVIGRDLDDLRLAYGLSTADACHLYGITIGKWSEIKNNPDRPIKDISLALFVRLLDGNPELFTPPQYPSPAEMKALFESCNGGKMEQKSLAVLLGNDGSSAYRWLKLGAPQKPSVVRLMLYLEKALLAEPNETRRAALETWRQIVRNEGLARSGEDVLKTGRWSNGSAETDQSK